MLLMRLRALPDSGGAAIRGGRLFSRPLFVFTAAFLLSLSAPPAQGDVHPLARDVTVTAPAESPLRFPDPPGTQLLPGTAPSPVGAGLLRFYGCITCHDLAVPPFTGRWGPDLDTVGLKTGSAWLHLWLSDPSAALPNPRMPHVPLSDRERSDLVAFLLTLTGGRQLQPQSLGDPGMGAELFTASQCETCHALKGAGGAKGPALDGLSGKTDARFLVPYLMAPSEFVPNTTMPQFNFSREQARHLSAYLLGDDTPVERGPVEGTVASGRDLFAQKGCAHCHRVGSIAKQLVEPDAGREAFVNYHASDGASPRIELRDAEREAMVRTLEMGADWWGLPRGNDEEFLDAFWSTPIRAQGRVPAAHDSISGMLAPESCATCHVQQANDWESSRHAAAMGPGVYGQLLAGDTASAGSCQACHAPNAEQHPPEDARADASFDPDLRRRGITCLACHVREHDRFGPLRADRAPVSRWMGPAHGGAIEAPVFSASAFCAPCHQFEPEDRTANGKLLQDTHAEWSESPQAAEGQTCQTCHMPERRHTWRGIHDPEMVRGAVGWDVDVVEGDDVRARITIENKGAGHHLPTYVTPRIFVNAWLVNAEGLRIEATRQARAIGRSVVLGDEPVEEYDTRIPAGGAWTWGYATKNEEEGVALVVRAEVLPDYFYHGFFELYDRERLTERAAALIDSAEATAAESGYLLFEERVEIER